MAINKIANLHKENDRISAAGTRAVYKAEKLKAAIHVAMQDDEMKKAVNEYIFNGDSEAVSPLQEIRDTNK